MDRKYDPITIVVIFVAAVAIFLIAVVVPWLRSRPISAPNNSCINNLRQIDGSTQQWALEHHKDTNAVPTWNEILPYMTGTPNCPKGGIYILGSSNRYPTCSIPGHAIP